MLGGLVGPAALLGVPDADHRRLSARGPFAGAPVGETGENPGDLLERADLVGATGRAHILALAQPVDGLHGGLRRLVVQELPVRHDHGRVVTGRVALDALQRDLAVVGRLVVPDTQVIGQAVEDRVAAHDRAQRVGADPDGVIAVRVPLVLRVERRDAAHLGLGQLGHRRAEGDAARRDVAVDALDQVQQGQQRRALLRVLRQHLFRIGEHSLEHLGLVPRGLLARLGAVVGSVEIGHGQRSTPPRTGSIEARATTVSAT